jgi:hypothetical protein
MLIDIHSEQDITKIEHFILKRLNSRRVDASIFKSKSYIDLRTTIINILDTNLGDNKYPRHFYFHNENLFLSILSSKPIIVWCGEKEWTL